MTPRDVGTAAYVVVTAARDAADVIGSTIDAVAGQTVTPARWVIVDDSSTDGTPAVLAGRAAGLPWVRVVRVDRPGGRSYAAKAEALRRAYAVAAGVEHTVVANLDADVQVPADYYERCLDRLRTWPTLGITGGVIVERTANGRRRRQRSSPRSVAGAVQVFRRDCWDAVGGYVALVCGGEDAIAEVLARAHGYDVAVEPALEVEHHGPVLGGTRSVLSARFRRGEVRWALGYDPLFQVAATLARLAEPPLVLGAMATLAGYGVAAARRAPLAPPEPVVALLRDEQRRRLGLRRATRAG